MVRVSLSGGKEEVLETVVMAVQPCVKECH